MNELIKYIEQAKAEMVVRAVLGGLGGLVIAFLMTLCWNIFRAPYRQRDEAIRTLESIPGATTKSPKVALVELSIPKVVYTIEKGNLGKPQIHIEPFIIAIGGEVAMESAKVEIAGGCESCYDWRTHNLWPGQTSVFGTHCKLPDNLAQGKHSIRFLIYARNEWWASEWGAISYEPSIPDMGDSQKQ